MQNDDLLKLLDWSTGDDTGASSMFLCRRMLGLKNDYLSCPSDAADRGRCIRLLNLVPGWWDRLDELANLPSHDVVMFSTMGSKVVSQGWAEQIPLIKAERNL